MSSAATRVRTTDPGVLQPALAGIVASLVGFAGSFAIVLAGLRAIGASPAESASGLLILSVLMGLCGIVLGLRYRMPIAIAWSTPGAALLVSAGIQPGGYSAALGAFVVTGVLIVLSGLWQRVGGWLSAIPAPLASALLAGVLLPVCLSPARAAVDWPGLAFPVIVVWAVLLRVGRRWAVPGALAAAAVAVAIDPSHGAGGHQDALPTLIFTMPSFHLGAIVGLAIPLFIVTMASQNITGFSVLSTFGYRPHHRPLLTSTGAATIVAAPFGGHAVNLAAITAALMAGPDAHPDPERRWIASVSSGFVYLVLGLAAGLATVLVGAAPPVLIEAVAGLALLPTLGGALATALADDDYRDAAVVTFAVSASAITAVGISAPFWGLVAGLLLLAWERAGRPKPAPALDR